MPPVKVVDFCRILDAQRMKRSEQQGHAHQSAEPAQQRYRRLEDLFHRRGAETWSRICLST